MKSLQALAANMVAVLLMTSAASAVSVTNREDREVKLLIVEGANRSEHVVRPAAVLDGVCKKGCIIRLNDSMKDEYELEGFEATSLEDGVLYFEGLTERNGPDAKASGTGNVRPVPN